jgi:hypothetical protein
MPDFRLEAVGISLVTEESSTGAKEFVLLGLVSLTPATVRFLVY